MAEFVYLLWAKEKTIFKIGKSVNPSSRLKELSTGSPYALDLLASKEVADGLAYEKALHSKWSDFRMNGEWFDIPMQKWEPLLLDFSVNPGLVSVLVASLEKIMSRFADFQRKSNAFFQESARINISHQQMQSDLLDALTDAEKERIQLQEELKVLNEIEYRESVKGQIRNEVYREMGLL